MRLSECPKNVVLIYVDGLKVIVPENDMQPIGHILVKIVDCCNYKFLKDGETYYFYGIDDRWQIYKEPTMNKIDNKSIQEMETEISNTEKSLEKMRKTLEEMKKQNIPELIVGEMYQICSGVYKYHKIVILKNENNNILAAKCECGCYFNRLHCEKSYFDDIKLIHLESPEDKIVAKFFINLYNNRS